MPFRVWTDICTSGLQCPIQETSGVEHVGGDPAERRGYEDTGVHGFNSGSRKTLQRHKGAGK